MGPPAIERPLVRFDRDEPSQSDEFLACLLDAPQADPEGVGDPRRLDPSPVKALPASEIKTADEVAQDGGDQGGPCAAG